ncbi:hypothetical protein MPHL43072_01805 [Mycolicibacterium phlei DSM 43072]|uniref:Uncharacterized protein n=1 Tax=Mycolicibacterium phlei DSM 43239 = CCUG 21000 TaxID=1226750 RepID=A0A5N5V2D1_MYCPH|nr:hypothetical protein MPHL21000_16145 [Mycolicibacterium phlei DSM 43239 = CCUG 21000]KXW65484.1 hypothetical protein MPHL43239_11965 [Mycolicibacterium phlei DSM 43239 = CCUG 21000]KXW71601.1 hypothetical protein MPHL43070_15820 [Mycolicibacterium phlei DSM 43070]KXW72538.1 hypothetical protein MPHL43072_01805 [Mycolicibacterium phlei DSM 43072]
MPTLTTTPAVSAAVSAVLLTILPTAVIIDARSAL